MRKNNLFRLTKIAVLSLVLASGSIFADIDYNKLPIKELTELVQKEDAQAQAELGYRYDEGIGLKKDYEKAVELYLKAEKQNNARAQNNLGASYHNGRGVRQDYAKAKELYEKAVANKEVSKKTRALAMNNLATLYMNGFGVETNYDKALELCLEAEKLEPHAGTEVDIGWLYEKKKDYSKAKEWYEKAIANKEGSKKIRALAMNNLATLYMNGFGVETNYDKALELCLEAEKLEPHARTEVDIGWLYEKKKDYSKAFEWYQKSAAQGYPIAQNNLGNLYHNGLGVRQDYAKAKELYEKAISNKSIDVVIKSKALNNLADLYTDGLGVETNFDKALELRLEAENLRPHSETEYKIGWLYGKKKDYKQAAEWYQKSAAQGDSWAQNNLGNLYRRGEGVAQDYKKAMELYQQAAAQGNDRAYSNIGDLYAEGLGVKRDDKKAFEYYNKALEAGNPYVYEDLVDFYMNGRGVAKDEVKALQLMLQKAPNYDEFNRLSEKYPSFNKDSMNNFLCKNKENADLIFNAGVRWGIPKEQNPSPEALIKKACSK